MLAQYCFDTLAQAWPNVAMPWVMATLAPTRNRIRYVFSTEGCFAVCSSRSNCRPRRAVQSAGRALRQDRSPRSS